VDGETTVVTRSQALRHAAEVFASSNIEDASLEAEILLRHALGISRPQVYLELEHELIPEENKLFEHLVARRLGHEPSAYITGHCEFYGLDFHVDRRVLIPRPESELLVEKAIEFARNRLARDHLTIADIGTGSGNIAISLALNLPLAKIYATDISSTALEVASINCKKHGISHRVFLLQGDLLHPLPEPVDLIVANLPYIEEPELGHLSPEISTFEPSLALAGGQDGLDKMRQTLAQAKEKVLPEGCLLLEIGQGQGEEAVALAGSNLPHAKVKLTPDLNGIDRVITVSL